MARCAVASASSSRAFPAAVISPPSLLVSTAPASIVQTVPVPVTVISPLSPSDTPPHDITISPLPSKVFPFIVLILVQDTKVSCFKARVALVSAGRLFIFNPSTNLSEDIVLSVIYIYIYIKILYPHIKLSI